MFRSERIQDLIEFKWNAYAWRFHFFGCMIHLAYIVILFMYTDVVYVRGVKAPPASATTTTTKAATLRMLRSGAGGANSANNYTPKDGALESATHEDIELEIGDSKYYSIVLLLGILYPAIYEII
jgi:hypothetical protein